MRTATVLTCILRGVPRYRDGTAAACRGCLWGSVTRASVVGQCMQGRPVGQCMQGRLVEQCMLRRLVGQCDDAVSGGAGGLQAGVPV